MRRLILPLFLAFAGLALLAVACGEVLPTGPVVETTRQALELAPRAVGTPEPIDVRGVRGDFWVLDEPPAAFTFETSNDDAPLGDWDLQGELTGTITLDESIYSEGTGSYKYYISDPSGYQAAAHSHVFVPGDIGVISVYTVSLDVRFDVLPAGTVGMYQVARMSLDSIYIKTGGYPCVEVYFDDYCSPTALSVDTWYNLVLTVVVDDTNGSISLDVDDVNKISESSIDTYGYTGLFSDVVVGAGAQLSSAGAVNVWIDDVYIEIQGEEASPTATPGYGESGSLIVGGSEEGVDDGVLYVSNNGVDWFETWTNAPGSIHSLTVYSGTIYAGVGNTVYSSPDGYNFTQVFTATGATEISALSNCGPDTRLWAGADDGKIYGSADGVTWGEDYDTGQSIVYDIEDSEIYTYTLAVTDGAAVFVASDCGEWQAGPVLPDDNAFSVVLTGGGELGPGYACISTGASDPSVWFQYGFTTTVASEPFYLETSDSNVTALGDCGVWGTSPSGLLRYARYVTGYPAYVDLTALDTGYQTIHEIIYFQGSYWAVAGGGSGAAYAGSGVSYSEIFTSSHDLLSIAGGEIVGGNEYGEIETPTPPGGGATATPTPTAPTPTPTNTPTPTVTPTPQTRLEFTAHEGTPTQVPILELGFSNASAATPGASATPTPTPTVTKTPLVCIEPTPLPTVIATVGPSIPGAVSLPVGDTFICDDQPDQNFGNVSTLSLNDGCAILMRWPLGGNQFTGQTVRSATLRLFTLGQPVANSGDSVFFINKTLPASGGSNWTELGATWNQRNATANWTTAGARSAGNDYDNTSTTGYVYIAGDETGWVDVVLDPVMVQGWINEPLDNSGILIWSTTAQNDVRIASSEWFDRRFRPQLILEATD